MLLFINTSMGSQEPDRLDTTNDVSLTTAQLQERNCISLTFKQLRSFMQKGELKIPADYGKQPKILWINEKNQIEDRNTKPTTIYDAIVCMVKEQSYRMEIVEDGGQYVLQFSNSTTDWDQLFRFVRKLMFIPGKLQSWLNSGMKKFDDNNRKLQLQTMPLRTLQKNLFMRFPLKSEKEYGSHITLFKYLYYPFFVAGNEPIMSKIVSEYAPKTISDYVNDMIRKYGSIEIEAINLASYVKFFVEINLFRALKMLDHDAWIKLHPTIQEFPNTIYQRYWELRAPFPPLILEKLTVTQDSKGKPLPDEIALQQQTMNLLELIASNCIAGAFSSNKQTKCEIWDNTYAIDTTALHLQNSSHLCFERKDDSGDEIKSYFNLRNPETNITEATYKLICMLFDPGTESRFQVDQENRSIIVEFKPPQELAKSLYEKMYSYNFRAHNFEEADAIRMIVHTYGNSWLFRIATVFPIIAGNNQFSKNVILQTLGRQKFIKCPIPQDPLMLARQSRRIIPVEDKERFARVVQNHPYLFHVKLSPEGSKLDQFETLWMNLLDEIQEFALDRFISWIDRNIALSLPNQDEIPTLSAEHMVQLPPEQWEILANFFASSKNVVKC